MSPLGGMHERLPVREIKAKYHERPVEGEMKSAFLNVVTDEHGIVSSGQLMARLNINQNELGAALGFAAPLDDKAGIPAFQQKLHDLVTIIDHVTLWTDSEEAAFMWYRSQPLPSFGDLTAQDLLVSGRSRTLKRHLIRISQGGYV